MASDGDIRRQDISSNIIDLFIPEYSSLTLKRRETRECVLSTVAIDALVLKHQAISIHITV